MRAFATVAPSCPPLLQEPLAADDAERLAAALKAIADPARLRLLSLIQAQPDHEACVCHLTEPLGLSQPTVSHHLKVLLQTGLVERDQRGSWAFFRVREEPLRAVRDLLAERLGPELEAGGRTRTDDPRLTRALLYQLSYSGAPTSVATVTEGLRGPSGARESCA